MTQVTNIPTPSKRSLMYQPINDFTELPWSNAAIARYCAEFTGVLATNTEMWTPSVFIIDSSDVSVSTVTISFSGYQIENFPVDDEIKASIAAGQSSGDTDNSFFIYDSYTGIAYQTQGTVISEGVISVTTAGAYDYIDAVGWWNNARGPYIGKASGCEFYNGLIGEDELLNGTINHAIVINFPSAHIRGATEDVRCQFPASTSDGTGTGGDNIPMGARLTLDPTITDQHLIDTYGLNQYDINMIAAIRSHGAYVTDSVGTSSAAFQFVNDAGADVYPVTNWECAILSEMRFVAQPFQVELDNIRNNDYIKVL